MLGTQKAGEKMAIQGDAIVNRILSDATARAEDITAVAKSQAEEIVEKARSFAKEKLKEAEKISKQNNQSVEEKYATLSKIEGNKILLKAKQEILEDLKTKALSFLLSMSKKEMLVFIENLLKEHASKDETLLFNIENVNLNDIKDLSIVKKLNLSVEENKNKEQVGIILSNACCDKNLLFDSLIEDAFLNSQEDIYRLLF